MSLISIIVPVFNEQGCLQELFRRLEALGGADTFEYIFVDDGSTDRSREIILGLEASCPRVRHIFFSRNFGHEVASTAGIDHASGEAIVLIDADLQDPPEVIPQLIQRWREGDQVVTAQRRARKGESPWKRATSWLFYRTIRKLSDVDMPADTGDFRLIDRRVANAFRRCREQSRFVRGLIAWAGFRQSAVQYDRDERYAGTTKYNAFKLIALALDAMIGFSIRPLRFAMTLGLAVTALSILLAGIVVIQKIFFRMPMQGYALLASGVFFLGGVQIFLIGLVGEYIGRTYRQTQQRPLYLVLQKSPQLPQGLEGLSGGDAPAAE